MYVLFVVFVARNEPGGTPLPEHERLCKATFHNKIISLNPLNLDLEQLNWSIIGIHATKSLIYPIWI